MKKRYKTLLTKYLCPNVPEEVLDEERAINQATYINAESEYIIKLNEMQNFFSDLFRFQFDYKLKIINFDDVIEQFNEASINE